jgi:hypothetical protein
MRTADLLTGWAKLASLTQPANRYRKPLRLSNKSLFKNNFLRVGKKAGKHLVFGVPHNILAVF